MSRRWCLATAMLALYVACSSAWEFTEYQERAVGERNSNDDPVLFSTHYTGYLTGLFSPGSQGLQRIDDLAPSGLQQLETKLDKASSEGDKQEAMPELFKPQNEVEMNDTTESSQTSINDKGSENLGGIPDSSSLFATISFGGTDPDINESGKSSSEDEFMRQKIGGTTGPIPQIGPLFIKKSSLGNFASQYKQPYKGKGSKSFNQKSKKSKTGKGECEKEKTSKSTTSKKAKTGDKSKGLRAKKSSKKPGILQDVSPSPSPSPTTFPSVSSASPTLSTLFPSSSPSVSTFPTPELSAFSPSAVDTPEIRRIIPNMLMAFADPDRQTEPTPADYDALATITMVWFEANIAASLADGVTFNRTAFTVQSTEYDSGYPESQYNILIDYGLVQFYFMQSSDTIAGPPSGAQIDLILRNSITDDYIINIVWGIEAFRGVNEVQYESVNNTFVPLPEEEPSEFPKWSQTLIPAEKDISSPTTDSTNFRVSAEPEDPVHRVHLGPIYFAYRATGNFETTGDPDTSPPSPDEYTQQAENAVEFLELAFSYHLREHGFAQDVFLGVDSSLDMTLWHAGIPEETFNIYMEYDKFDFLFAPQSNIDSIPDESEIYQFLQKTVESQAFVIATWNAAGTFASVDSAVAGRPES